MVRLEDIADFFREETRASIESIFAFYDLDIAERVRKRKAVEHVRFDPEYKKFQHGSVQIKALAPVNLADFKVGEYLIIHEGNPRDVISSCTLDDFTEDGAMILSFSKFNISGYNRVDQYIKEDAGREYILDKDIVNMSDIYNAGTAKIANRDIRLVNEVPVPVFSDNRKEILSEIEDTEKNFEIHLTDKQREAVANALLAEDYYLIQGPPGTGKSFVIAVLLLELLLFCRKRVLVSGPNHLAINNVLGKLLNLYPDLSYRVRKIGQYFNTAGLEYKDDKGEILQAENQERVDWEFVNSQNVKELGIGWTIGCTPFHMHTSRAKDIRSDVLVIDEAGQLNMGLALMAMGCADKVILVGDHKQMAPIFSSDNHPEELKHSIFEHLYREYNCTTLDTTYRMNAPICNTISSIFYRNVLKSAVGEKRLDIGNTGDNTLLSPEYPVVVCNIKHYSTNYSDEEADVCMDIIKEYMCRYHCSAGDIAVIAPFRAQCALIRRKLRNCQDSLPDYSSILVETVDRMQGQEREIVIISLTAGKLEYMTELKNFIFNPNRFNVAVSRARNKLVILGNITTLREAMKYMDCSWLEQLLESDDVKIME